MPEITTPNDMKQPTEVILFIGSNNIKTKTALKIIGAKDDAKYLPIELRIPIPIEDRDISKI